MTLNLPRVFSRSALAAAIGHAVASSSKPVTAAIFDGIAESAEEAEELAFRVNVQRKEARLAALARQGTAAVLGGAG